MSDWQTLREFLRADLAAQLDRHILSDPDPHARAFLAGNRERVLAILIDQAELVALRQILAQRDAAAERESEPTSIIKLNGHTSAKRCVKV